MQGRTTVVVAHRLSTIRDADSIAVVSRGRIIEQVCTLPSLFVSCYRCFHAPSPHVCGTERLRDAECRLPCSPLQMQGNHAELMTHPNGAYARLVKHQLTRGRSTVKMSFAARGSEAVLSGVAEEEEDGAQ